MLVVMIGQHSRANVGTALFRIQSGKGVNSADTSQLLRFRLAIRVNTLLRTSAKSSQIDKQKELEPTDPMGIQLDIAI